MRPCTIQYHDACWQTLDDSALGHRHEVKESVAEDAQGDGNTTDREREGRQIEVTYRIGSEDGNEIGDPRDDDCHGQGHPLSVIDPGRTEVGT